MFFDDLVFGEKETGHWEIVEYHCESTLYTPDGLYTVGDEYKGQKYDGLGLLPSWLSYNPPPEKLEDVAARERNKRNGLLYQLDQVVMNPLRWEELDESEKQGLGDYRLLLLDVPQQAGFPDVIYWPEKPEALQ